MVRVGCRRPLRQYVPPSSVKISSSVSAHCFRRRSLSLLLLTDKRSLAFTLRMPSASLRRNTACESPELARYTLSLWTTAVMAQLPTLRIRLLPILICCSQLQKKQSSIRWQLHRRDSLMASPIDAKLESRSERQLSMKLWILLRQYSASYGPPCPSNTLMAQAPIIFSWSQAKVSSQGLFASYCNDFTRFSIMFLTSWWSECGKEQVDLQVSSSSWGFSSGSSRAILKGGSLIAVILGAARRCSAGCHSLRAWKVVAKVSGEELSVRGWISLFLSVGIMSLNTENEFMSANKAYIQLRLKYHPTYRIICQEINDNHNISHQVSKGSVRRYGKWWSSRITGSFCVLLHSSFFHKNHCIPSMHSINFAAILPLDLNRGLKYHWNPKRRLAF